jgi:hypothetical protein
MVLPILSPIARLHRRFVDGPRRSNRWQHNCHDLLCAASTSGGKIGVVNVDFAATHYSHA